MGESQSGKCARCGTDLCFGPAGELCPRCLIALNLTAPTELPEGNEQHRAALEPPLSLDEVGRHFPQLEILGLLGKGGMGAVYKARQKQLDRVVALKILPRGVNDDPAFAERFTREAKMLARLNHPNIVTLFEFGRADGLYYLLMEYVDGMNLRELMNSGQLKPEEALAIVPQICEALQYAHKRGIVHRDIKPENLLLSSEGELNIADFGLAKLIGGSETPLPTEPPGGVQTPQTQASDLSAGRIMGTPQYMAPEQVANPLQVDHRADIYALGVVFYQMLTGELPTGKFAPPSRTIGVDVRLDEVVSRAMARDPERRFQQAADVKTAVETIAHSPKPRARGLSRPGNVLITLGLLNLIFYLAWNLTTGTPDAFLDPNLSISDRLLALLVVAFNYLRIPAAALSLLMILGGWRMRTLRSRRLCAVATWVGAFLPPFCVVGFPLAIWTLRRVNRAAFTPRADESGTDAAAASPPMDPAAPGLARIGMWVSAAAALLIVVVISAHPRGDMKVNFELTSFPEVLLYVPLLCAAAAALLAPTFGWLAWDGLGKEARPGTVRDAAAACALFPAVTLIGKLTPDPALDSWRRGLALAGVIVAFGLVAIVAWRSERSRERLFVEGGRRSRRLWWGWTALLVAYLGVMHASNHATAVTARQAEADSVPDKNRWQEMAVADVLQGRSSATATWTGKELIVFGGEGPGVSFGDGARFDPVYDKWQLLPAESAPKMRTGATAVWTGNEVIIWGGFGGINGNDVIRADGARFDPLENAWVPVSEENAPQARFDHSAVWSGKEMLVWGGYTDSHARYSGARADAHLNTGGAYDPKSDRWHALSTKGAPSKRFHNVAVWTGKEMLIWGGADSATALADGARYNPAKDTWRPMAGDGAPSPRLHHIAVWTGKEMIVWGGGALDGNEQNAYLQDGAWYDPERDTWRPISKHHAPQGRVLTTAVWTGTEMVLWGGVNDTQTSDRFLATGGRYNPATDTWTEIPGSSEPSARLASIVWTGKGLLIFGGYNGVHLNDTWFLPMQRR